MSTTHSARPQTMGSWTFELHEREDGGDLAARIALKGTRGGEIQVGNVPFRMERETMSRTFRLLFEGRAMVRADAEGAFSNTHHLFVERGLLEAGAAIGEIARMDWVPQNLSGTAYELRAGEAAVGRVEKTSMWFRHFALRFDASVPLALRAFCLALLLVRLRQSNG